jgi:hypothetical protein
MRGIFHFSREESRGLFNINVDEPKAVLQAPG